MSKIKKVECCLEVHSIQELSRTCGCASFAPVFWGFSATRVLDKMATSDGLALTLRHFGFTSSDLPDGSMVRSPLRKGPVGAAFGWRWRPEPSCLCRSTHQVLFPSAEREGVGCDKNRTFILQKVSLTNYHIEFRNEFNHTSKLPKDSSISNLCYWLHLLCQEPLDCRSRRCHRFDLCLNQDALIVTVNSRHVPMADMVQSAVGRQPPSEYHMQIPAFWTE